MENRSTPRHRVLKAGTIIFNRAGGIDCLVRDMSSTGARLAVESPLDIPDDIILVIEKENIKKSCRVAWRQAKMIGVEFI